MESLSGAPLLWVLCRELNELDPRRGGQLMRLWLWNLQASLGWN